MTKLYDVLSVIPEMTDVLIEANDDRTIGNHRQKNWVNCTTMAFLEKLAVASVDVACDKYIRIILADKYNQDLHNFARRSNSEAISEAFAH